jgi:predicted DNA-binding protein
LNSKIIHVNFFTEKDDRIVKLAHGVKKIKWEWIKNICENGIEDYNDFWWQVEEKWGHIHVHILHS